MKTAVGSTARLGWKTTRDEELEQSRRALPRNLIRPLPYRITKASGFGDLLSRSPVHAGARDEVDYGGDKTLDRFQDVCGGSRARVYIGAGAQWRNPRQRGPRPRRTPEVGYNSPRSGSDPNRLVVTRPSKTRSNARFSCAAKI
jgi:hypothetical protein